MMPKWSQTGPEIVPKSFPKPPQNNPEFIQILSETASTHGPNENAELINGRLAMIGFLMFIITELVFGGTPVTHTLFGIG